MERFSSWWIQLKAIIERSFTLDLSDEHKAQMKTVFDFVEQTAAANTFEESARLAEAVGTEMDASTAQEIARRLRLARDTRRTQAAAFEAQHRGNTS